MPLCSAGDYVLRTSFVGLAHCSLLTHHLLKSAGMDDAVGWSLGDLGARVHHHRHHHRHDTVR